MADEFDSRVDTKIDRRVSTVMRLLISVALPTWGVVMIILGIGAPNGYWIGAGAVVVVIGIILFPGSTIVDLFPGANSCPPPH